MTEKGSDTPGNRPDQSRAEADWERGERRMSLYSMILSAVSVTLSFGLGVFIYIVEEWDEKFERSVSEVDRVYDPKFSDALTTVLEAVYKFYEDPANLNLSADERYVTFWREADVDREMLVVLPRITTIANCVERDQCYPEEVYNRFPEITLQAIYFMREFLWPDFEAEVDEGWSIGSTDYMFLANMCEWTVSKYGDFPLWSAHHEELRSPDDPAPNPCFERIEFID